MFRDINPFLVIALILGAIVVGVLIAGLPGHIARRRGHASARAIHICGLCGLLFFPAWIAALVWAYTGPDNGGDPQVGDYHYGTLPPPTARDTAGGMPGRSRRERPGRM